MTEQKSAYAHRTSNIFGSRIAGLRKQHKISQEELSRRLEMSQSTVAMWEKGKRDPDTAMISKLANLFNVSTDYLLGHTDAPKDLLNSGMSANRLKEIEAIYQYPDGNTYPGELIAEIKRLKEREQKLIEGLRFYACHDNYLPPRPFATPFVIADVGEKARDILKEIGVNTQ